MHTVLAISRHVGADLLFTERCMSCERLLPQRRAQCIAWRRGWLKLWHRWPPAHGKLRCFSVPRAVGAPHWLGACEIDTHDIKDLGKVVIEKGQQQIQQGVKSWRSAAGLRLKDASAPSLSVEGTPTSKTPRSSRTPKRTKSLTGAKNALMARLIGPDGNLATNALAGEEDAFRLQDLPEGRRDRKRYNCRKERRKIGRQDPWVGEVMDLLAEEVFLRNVEQPWYLAPCMEQGSCQRVCFPAEFATRHKREKQGGHEMQGGSSNHKGNDMYEDGRRTGTDAPQNIASLGWPDMNVPNKLGLVQAIHRKTSIERLCLIKPKHELPPKSGPKEVRSLVRQLQKCDHANVLYLHEALEDQSHLYFMYEQYSCVTLQSVLDTQWTQEKREGGIVIVAMFQLHLSWTLSHVLIPATRRKHPMLCKVFGLGLMGVVINDTSSSDHLCWAPECIERFHHVGPNGFLQKVEQSMKPMCDSWSLGTIVYSLVCRRPPAVTEAQAGGLFRAGQKGEAGRSKGARGPSRPASCRLCDPNGAVCWLDVAVCFRLPILFSS
eukprot:g7295.t1